MMGRISIRIAVIVGTLALVGAVVVSGLSYGRILAQETAESGRQLRQLAQTVEQAARIAAYLDSPELAQEVLAGLAINELVAGGELRSLTGLTVARGAPVGSAAPGLGRLSPVHLVLESPFAPGQQVGDLRIQPSHSVIQRSARAAAFSSAMNLGAHTLVVALLVMIIIQWQFVPALKTVAHALHHVRPGSDERVVPPPAHRHNEIGGLVRDVNRLLGLVQEQIESERKLRNQVASLERRFRMIYERASVGIFLLDHECRLLMANGAFFELAGERFWECQRDQGGDCLEPLFAHPERGRDLIKKSLKSAGLATADLQLARLDTPEPIWVHCLFTRLRSDSEASELAEENLVQGILSDISERKREEVRMRNEASCDPLTQLLNRRAGERQLDAMLDQAGASGRVVTVGILDLDDFKPVNDRHGHEAGDRVLVEIARRLREALRDGDLLVRLGGDEFLFAIAWPGTEPDLDALSTRLLQRFRRPIGLAGGASVQVGASIGVAAFPHHGCTVAELIQHADQAMYRVKRSGKRGFALHAPCAVEP